MTLDLFEGYELETAFEEGANLQKKRSNATLVDKSKEEYKKEQIM